MLQPEASLCTILKFDQLACSTKIQNRVSNKGDASGCKSFSEISGSHVLFWPKFWEHNSWRILLPSKICKILNGKVEKNKKGELISERYFLHQISKKRVPNHYLLFLETWAKMIQFLRLSHLSFNNSEDNNGILQEFRLMTANSKPTFYRSEFPRYLNSDWHYLDDFTCCLRNWVSRDFKSHSFWLNCDWSFSTSSVIRFCSSWVSWPLRANSVCKSEMVG